MARTKKDEQWLSPVWFKRTAAIAAKRGAAIVFSKDRQVYGHLPNRGGSVSIHYKTDDAWISAVLERFPTGAVFPDNGFYGGSSTAKAIKPYAAITLPEDGGSARIDAVTKALHVKGCGVTIHSASFGANDCKAPTLSQSIRPFALEECVTKEVEKMLVENVARADSRPALGRVFRIEMDGDSYLGSTDGKSAFACRCSDLPDGFSYDPSLVALSDIEAYGNDVIEQTGATVHTFVLSDGTVVVETVQPIETPSIAAVIGSFMKQERRVCLEAHALRALVETVSALSLGSEDRFGGILVLSSEGASMVSGGDTVADFEAAPQIEPGATVRFALTNLKRASAVGGDMLLLADGPMICTAGQVIFVAAPVTIKREDGDSK